MPPPRDRRPTPIINTGCSLDSPRMAAVGCGLLVFLIGLVVLAGWATNTPVLKAAVPGWNAMQPLTALAFVCAGGALLLGVAGRGRLQGVMIGLVAVIAGSALVQAILGLSLGVDTLLFDDQVRAQALRFPGRMAEASAAEFLLFSASLALSRRSGGARALAILGSLGLVMGAVGLVGYLFGSAGLARFGSYASMAVHTSAAFLLLFLGVLLLAAEATWMGTLLSARVGGVVARRMVPGVIGFPLAVGLIASHWSGIWGTAAATAVGVSMVVVMAGLAIMVLWVARTLNAIEERGEVVGRAFRRAEARFRSVVDTAVDAMVVIDEAGVVQSFNRAAETMFGLKTEDAVGRNVSILMPEPHASQHDRYIQAYLRTGVARIIGIGREVEGKRADGTLFPLDLSIAEWRDEDRRFFTGIMRDISARRAAEMALRESEARFRTVFEQAAIGIERIGLDGRFLDANATSCAMLGYSREELSSLTIADLTHPAELPEERRLIAEMQAGIRDSYVIEKRRRRRDGTYIWVRVTSSVPRANTRLPYRVSVVEDITERKAFEQRLREAKEAAEKANRDKSRFLAAASHDLRQPVQAMVLMASVMAEQLRGHPAEKLVANTTKAIDALQTLLSGLLDVSRLDAGVVRPEPRDFPLGDLLDRLASEYGLLAVEKGLALRAVRCTAIVRTDPTLLERILRNLLDNAVRYTEAGGIVVGCRRRGESVAVQVVDTGIGIANEDQDAIFQEFYQVGNPERDRTQGLGLGLAIVRRLTRLLGFRLGITSLPGRGTCFAIELPVIGREAPAATRAADQEVAAPKRGGTVLVIDDEPMVRLGIAAILESWGYEVISAGDAQEAVAWVTGPGGRCPDLILADYRLREGHTGVNAVREVHLACGQKVRAVIITGDTAPENLAEVARSGFEIAHKPVAPERLRQLVTPA